MSAPFKFDLETARPLGKNAPDSGEVSITPRNRRFTRESGAERWWYKGDPVATAWHNSLSIAFPRGEAFFVETIKAHREGAPPKLEIEIRAFIVQEVNHTREHIAFNRAAREAGYDLSPIDDRLERVVMLANRRSPVANLAATMALEHLTAIMAHQQLKHPERFMEVEGDIGEMWLWHAVEEIEHKAVAYDTWLYVTRDWGSVKRWSVKSLLMLIATRNFVRDRMADMKDLLEQDGLSGGKWRRKTWKYLLWSPGILRKVFPLWLAFFKPGFHPWNLDDRHLIRKFDSEYPDAVMEPDSPIVEPEVAAKLTGKVAA